jgi:hypothetical protein
MLFDWFYQNAFMVDLIAFMIDLNITCRDIRVHFEYAYLQKLSFMI